MTNKFQCFLDDIERDFVSNLHPVSVSETHLFWVLN